MSYHSIFNNQNDPNPEPSIFTTREKVVQSLTARKVCDVLVVGGGIHGAAFAHAAAFNGLSVVLLEQADYAFGTSSRSTKLIHGGLRYLELFDFKQVLSGISAREDLFTVAEHIVKPQRFLIPVKNNSCWHKFKLGLGLTFYDLLVKGKERKHFWQSDLADTLMAQATGFSGCYNYCDGTTEDSRLVIEHILAARQEGARCLNYAKVISLQQKTDDTVKVSWVDTISKQQYEITTGLVVNCTGPWIAELGRITAGPLQDSIKYSQGSHIIFDRPYTGPCLFLPRKEKARYLLVLPHPAGTLVGTTEREVDRAELEAWPTADEISEIYNLLENDFSFLGLKRNMAHYCYAGVRTIPLRKKGKSSSQMSRRHLWQHSNGVLSLIGGKYTDARLTAFEGLEKIYKLSNVLNIPEELKGRLLPGASMLTEVANEFQKAASAANVPENIIQQTIARRGSLVRYFQYCKNPFRVLADTVLAGDIELSIRAEQAHTLDDIMRRRCMLECLKGHGQAAVDQIQKIFAEFNTDYDLEKNKSQFEERIKKITELLG